MKGIAIASRRLRTALLAAAAAAALGGIGALSWTALRTSPTALARAREGFASPAADGVQEIALESRAGDYEPNVVHARAGQPLRLRVTRRERHTCGSRLVVPDLGVDLELPAGGTESFVLPAAPRGEYLFTCGHKMVKGVLLIE